MTEGKKKGEKERRREIENKGGRKRECIKEHAKSDYVPM